MQIEVSCLTGRPLSCFFFRARPTCCQNPFTRSLAQILATTFLGKHRRHVSVASSVQFIASTPCRTCVAEVSRSDDRNMLVQHDSNIHVNTCNTLQPFQSSLPVLRLVCLSVCVCVCAWVCGYVCVCVRLHQLEVVSVDS